MGMTMTQKILAAHCGEASVTAGQLINAKLDIGLRIRTETVSYYPKVTQHLDYMQH